MLAPPGIVLFFPPDLVIKEEQSHLWVAICIKKKKKSPCSVGYLAQKQKARVCLTLPPKLVQQPVTGEETMEANDCWWPGQEF